MEKTLEELEQILSREAQIHSSLVQTAQDLNQAIKENNLTALQKYTFEQDKQICQIEKLEESRVECISKLSDSLGLTQIPLKIQFILEKVPQQWHERISQIQSVLKEKIRDLSKINTSNKILMQEALGIISNTFSLLQQTNDKFSQYGTTGKAANVAAGRNLINRIA